MPVTESVESLAVASLTNRNAVKFISRGDDGREREFAVDIFAVDDEFALGVVLDTEEERPGGASKIKGGENTMVARLPLMVTLGRGEVGIETGPIKALHFDDPNLWQVVPVTVQEIILLERSDAEIREDRAKAANFLKGRIRKVLEDSTEVPPVQESGS